MTKTDTIGTCALCLEPDLHLQDSHLLSQAAYKPLRAREQPNPHPILLGANGGYTSSKQFHKHLLCSDCEERFHVGGEDWIFRHSYLSDGTFRFREILTGYAPALEDGENRVYACANIPELEIEKVIFFAASVIWRGGM